MIPTTFRVLGAMSRNLPSDLTPVKGLAGISEDLGVNVSSNHKIEISFTFENVGGVGWLVGFNGDAGSFRFCVGTDNQDLLIFKHPQLRRVPAVLGAQYKATITRDYTELDGYRIDTSDWIGSTPVAEYRSALAPLDTRTSTQPIRDIKISDYDTSEILIDMIACVDNTGRGVYYDYVSGDRIYGFPNDFKIYN